MTLTTKNSLVLGVCLIAALALFGVILSMGAKSVKQLERNPWEDMAQKYPVRTKITGKVTSVADSGVFVELEPGIEGLVYASEVGRDVENLRDAVEIGQDVECLVVRVDPGEQKIALSMRAIADREEREAIARVSAQARTQTTTLGEQFSSEMLEKLRGGDREDEGQDD